MTDSISKHPPTEGEMKSIVDSVADALDGESIVTTRVVEPMDKEEREGYVEQLVEALEE